MHRREGERGNSLARDDLSGLQPRGGFIFQSGVHVVKECHDFSVEPIVSVSTIVLEWHAGTRSFLPNRIDSELTFI